MSRLHDHLIELRGQTADQIAALTREFDGIVEASELVATDDEHDPEGATIAYERAKAASLRTSAEQRLNDLDDALRRIERGTYGFCARCGEPIGDERIEAIPSAARCIDCALLR